jgi:hypothetical protein
VSNAPKAVTDETPKLWRRLGVERVGSLDYSVPQYHAEWLTHAANQLQGTPEEPVPTRPLDHAIGACLLLLSETPSALKELNHYLQRAPQKVRALNVAVHYCARRELDGEGNSSRSRGIVAQTWGIKDASVKDAHRKYGKDAALELEHLVKLCTSRPHQPCTRSEVLEALDADMCERARLPWFKLREAAKIDEISPPAYR